MNFKIVFVTIYFISGLGADKRVFQNLILPEKFSLRYLDWLEPKSSESLVDYSRRLAGIIDTSEQFILIGLSFGGMIATEISQILSPKQIIIISSAGCRKELPWYFRLAGSLRLNAIIPPSLLKMETHFSYWLFGTRTTESKNLLRQIIKETSPQFLKWAIKAILNWKRVDKPPGIYHIHGGADRLLPARYIKSGTIIKKGTHFMVFDMASELSRLITERISQVNTKC